MDKCTMYKGMAGIISTNIPDILYFLYIEGLLTDFLFHFVDSQLYVSSQGRILSRLHLITV